MDTPLHVHEREERGAPEGLRGVLASGLLGKKGILFKTLTESVTEAAGLDVLSSTADCGCVVMVGSQTSSVSVGVSAVQPVAVTVTRTQYFVVAAGWTPTVSADAPAPYVKPCLPTYVFPGPIT